MLHYTGVNNASLRIGCMSLIPLYLIGGLLSLLALRYYPGDLAYVVAHARAKRIAGEMPDQEQPDVEVPGSTEDPTEPPDSAR